MSRTARSSTPQDEYDDDMATLMRTTDNVVDETDRRDKNNKQHNAKQMSKNYIVIFISTAISDISTLNVVFSL